MLGQSTLFSAFAVATKRRRQESEDECDEESTVINSCSEDGSCRERRLPENTSSTTQQESEQAAVVDPDAVPAVHRDVDQPTLSDIGSHYRAGESGLPRWDPHPRNLSSADKWKVAKNHFGPGELFVFPTVTQSDGKKRKFQRRWLQEYSWLVYSRKWSGGFCMPCVLFSPESCKLGQLYTEPLLNLTRFKSACDRHTEYEAHKNSLAMFDGLLP